MKCDYIKLGEYIIAKRDYETPITSGDGVVGSFKIKKNDKFYIIEIDNIQRHFKIDYDGYGLWFSYDKPDFFLDFYEKFFYNINITKRKEKLRKINEM